MTVPPATWMTLNGLVSPMRGPLVSLPTSGLSGALQGRQTLRNSHKPPQLVNSVTAGSYRVCLRKPSNDGNCEPTLGAGGRRFKSCLSDKRKPVYFVVPQLCVLAKIYTF